MATWIKLCGITCLEDALVAVQSGADAVGFIFAESPRLVAPQAAGGIAASLPPAIEKIGVFVDASLAEIVETVRIAGLTGVQLHQENDGDDAAGLASDLRARFSNRETPLKILQVLHYETDDTDFAEKLRAMRSNAAIDAVLVDTRSATRQGGTGRSFNWRRAQETFLREASHLRLIAAGGLNPENVTRAIHMLQPWGVDVASGVETSPGRKDPGKVAAFVRAARAAAAAARIENEPASARS